MTVRPADGPISLDTLIARATPTPRALPASDPARVYRPPPPRIDPPLAVVLVTTVATCECGRIHRMPNTSCLVRYDTSGMSNSVNFRRADIEGNPAFMRLPREHKEHTISVPFCEGCF
jgi:hypothetical protein